MTPSQQNEQLIKQFYTAFQQKDYATMQSLYHDQAKFSDPVFGSLNATKTRAMWKMLVGAAKELKVAFSDLSAVGNTGSCKWEAWYTFSRTGKKVHNIIYSSFEFKDGKIFRHHDNFDFWRWSRQALGITGAMLGWSQFLRKKVSTTALTGLDKFMKSES